jgi:anaerobic magnesium-protoporphyrin IX monomethyl ester cyclase
MSAQADIRSRERSSSADLGPAVLSTLAYGDLFGYPLGIGQVHRYLHGSAATPDSVEAAVDALVAGGRLITDGHWLALPGRDHFFEQRRSREKLAERLWAKARRYARALACVPTVRMVGVTGSLAVDNTDAGADIDFMLIVDGGTVWRTRALAKLMEQIDHRCGGDLCVNYFLSERALTLEERSLYVAHELAQMVPLYGLETYESLREHNRWAAEYLPNAAGPPRSVTPVRPPAALRGGLRPLVRCAAARRLEAWECARKLRRYNETDFLCGKYSRFRREATGHRLDMRDEIERIHRARLRDTDAARPLRLLFGQSYHLHFDAKLWREMKPYPPLGALYGAAVAREAGHDVRFFDSMLATSHTAWKQALDRHRPDVVVLFEDNFNYLTKMCLSRMREAAVEMIGMARRIGARVVVCSSDATDDPRIYVRAGAEFVVRGEGERPLLGLLEWMGRGGAGARSPVPGVTYAAPDGALVENARTPAMRALDDLPFPAWDLVNLRRYAAIWRQRHGRFSLNLVTTRGCPYHCNWCAKPIWGQRYHSRSPENVADELARLNRAVKVDHVWFMDDIFGLKPGWIERFADCLDERGIRIRFKCLTRPDLLRRPGEIQALARAGCEVVWIGAESGSQKILDAMEKGTRVEDIERTSEQLKAAGIRVGHFIQFGYPGETWRDIRQTLAMLRRVRPDELGVSVSYPLPGTAFHERVKAQLSAKRHWRDSDDLAMLFQGTFRTAFYRRLHRYAHRSLAWHRTWRDLRDGSLFSAPPGRQLRRIAGFGVNTVALPVLWTALRAASLRGGYRLNALPTALDRGAAATPTDQGT